MDSVHVRYHTVFIAASHRVLSVRLLCVRTLLCVSTCVFLHMLACVCACVCVYLQRGEHYPLHRVEVGLPEELRLLPE